MCVFKVFRIVNVDVERCPVSVGPPGGGRSYANVEVCSVRPMPWASDGL